MDRLNFLNYYERSVARGEVRFTRAFLVLARLVPQVRAALAEIIRDEQIKQNVPEASRLGDPLRFMEAAVHVQSEVPWVGAFGGAIVPVALADQKMSQTDAAARQTSARHDGLIAHKSAGEIVLENKLWVDAIAEKEFRPRLSAETDQDRLCERGVSLEWAQVIERLSSLLTQEVVRATERDLVSDFLEFVADEQPHMNPYRTFELCGNQLQLLQKRCSLLRQEVAGELSINGDVSGGIPLNLETTRTAYIEPLPLREKQFDGISLELYPADLVSQAREFLAMEPAEADAFFALGGMGWRIGTCLHFSFRGTHLVYPQSSTIEAEVRAYFDYWQENVGRYVRRVPHEKFDELIEGLCNDGQIGEDDAIKFRDAFQTRTFADICPGFELSFRVSAEECLEIENRGDVHQMLAARIREAQAVLR